MFLFWLGGIIISLYGIIKILISYLNSSHEKFWKRLGVEPEAIEVSLIDRITEKKTFMDIEEELYTKVKARGLDYVGLTELGTRLIYFVSPEFHKTLLVRDSEIWMNRRDLQLHDDPILGKMLLFMGGQEWKEMRSLLSPNFSTGKIRRMFERIEDCSTMLIETLKERMGTGRKLEVDMRDVASSYTMDAIASTFFGIEAGTIKDRDAVFAQMGRTMQQQTALGLAKFLIALCFPKLGQKLGIKFFEQTSTDFFFRSVKQTIEYREKNNVRRQDFLQLLIDHKKEGSAKLDLNELNNDIISSSSVLFLLGGFDTVEGLLSCASYNLAIHPEFQDRIAEEVNDVIARNDGKLTYDALNTELDFLDRFVSETLRLYPPFIRTERSNLADYTIPGTKVTIPKGTIAGFPIYAMHLDPEVYPDPKKFDPDRFLPEEKNKIKNFYMPFGLGPRNCIGMRYALVEAKACLANLVANFKLEPSPNLQIPLKITIQSGGVKPVGKVYINLTPRNKI